MLGLRLGFFGKIMDHEPTLEHIRGPKAPKKKRLGLATNHAHLEPTAQSSKYLPKDRGVPPFLVTRIDHQQTGAQDGFLTIRTQGDRFASWALIPKASLLSRKAPLP
jgi:hypothetical protein